jgi:biotin carboxylase
VVQKYLFEVIDAPLIPSYVFYDEKEALEWAKNTEWPKVFKLTGGVGSSNVRLIKSEKEAKKVIRRSFRKGYVAFNQRKYS